ncbi:uncharacterized protein F5147DRAFT_30422 [Suillus discolor]|uniref:Uncharacterized protein n=1 Tax=Suillus discolor TaxID=1912936 RepID=A0A9P7JMQ7_9AGAM|nr:uncharacterized protein F5147DRAFT_30422 [Suillus discolor]KAG2089841.1 hypothetical protein F5147DRAFT_30422 [Suillus discolor]
MHLATTEMTQLCGLEYGCCGLMVMIWNTSNQIKILTRILCSRRELLVSLVSHHMDQTDDKRDELTNVTYRLNRRLLLRENRKSSRGDAQSRGGGLNAIGFAAGDMQSHRHSLENLKNRDVQVQVFQETARPINQEQNRVSKPAVVHIRASVSTDGESNC